MSTVIFKGEVVENRYFPEAISTVEYVLDRMTGRKYRIILEDNVIFRHNRVTGCEVCVVGDHVHITYNTLYDCPELKINGEDVHVHYNSFRKARFGADSNTFI